jgi:hypothetical protein
LFYLCFVKKDDSDKIQILKELHLNHQQAPHSNATNEHYCRRWIAVKNLHHLKENETMTDAQISHYKDQGVSYLVISTSQKILFLTEATEVIAWEYCSIIKHSKKSISPNPHL